MLFLIRFALRVWYFIWSLMLKLPGMDRVVALAIHFMTEHRGWVSQSSIFMRWVGRGDEGDVGWCGKGGTGCLVGLLCPRLERPARPSGWSCLLFMCRCLRRAKLSSHASIPVTVTCIEWCRPRAAARRIALIPTTIVVSPPLPPTSPSLLCSTAVFCVQLVAETCPPPPHLRFSRNLLPSHRSPVSD